ncbi:hypothetical protein Asp14428_68640 [Actinoplanes sp. NBRC 14428]|nr:hypothetical protein Asp14428_68640 [Actinoplanes sp. NBRC 14428]
MDRLSELWNEAVDLAEEGDVPPGTPEGMARLADVLRVYNSIMGGGVGFALEVNEPSRVGRAVDGLRYLGLSEVAGLLADIADGYRAPGGGAAGVAEQEKRLEELLDLQDPVEDAFRLRARAEPREFGLEQ